MKSTSDLPGKMNKNGGGKYYLLWLGLFALLVSATVHKFFVSSTKVVYNVPAQNMEITIRVFTDDLEAALGANESVPLHLGEETEAGIAKMLVRDYMRQHFKLVADELPVQLSFVGRETENDQTYCYFEFPPIPGMRHLTIENTLLLDAFPDQKNYVELEMQGWKQSLVFTSSQTIQTVDL